MGVMLPAAPAVPRTTTPAVAAPVTSAVATPSTAATGTGLDPGPRVVVTVLDPRISESSGLVASPHRADLMWTVNDSGHSADVYGVSLRTGRTVAVLRLAGTQARDWEAMAAGRGAGGAGLLWVGDVGDNNAVRESVVLRLLREPAPVRSATLVPVSLRVRYPDGPHDVETLIWTADRRLLLVSKELFGGVVYQVPSAAVAAALSGRSTVKPVLAIPLARVDQSLVTDGAALPDGRIVLRGYGGATVYPDPAVGGRLDPLQEVALPPQPQGETLAVVESAAAVIVGSEGVRQPLWRVRLPLASSASPSSVPTSSASPSSVPTSSPTQLNGGTHRESRSRATGGTPGPLLLGLPLGAIAVAGIAVMAVIAALARRRQSGGGPGTSPRPPRP